MHPRHRLPTLVTLLAAIAFLVPTSPVEAQAGQAELALSGFGGFATDPGGFDVFRQTEFDAGFHLGGTVSFRLSEHLAIRGGVIRTWSDGRETGVLDEAVDFERTYHGTAVEGRVPLGSLTPYGFAGAGMVSVDRSANDLSYDFTTLGGNVGSGVAYPFPGAPLELFVEGGGWFYERVSTGQGTQFDFLLSAGVTFVPEL